MGNRPDSWYLTAPVTLLHLLYHWFAIPEMQPNYVPPEMLTLLC
jgi:hypothetical protein